MYVKRRDAVWRSLYSVVDLLFIYQGQFVSHFDAAADPTKIIHLMDPIIAKQISRYFKMLADKMST